MNNDLQSLLRLQSWLSPAFPTGAFSYSGGLEAAVANGFVETRADLEEWLNTVVQHGTGWNDLVLLGEGWRQSANNQDIRALAELAEAMNVSAGRHMESIAQGTAFLEAAKAWCVLDTLPKTCALPVAVGAVSAKCEVGLEQTQAAFLHAFISNQIQAALRLMDLGQKAGVELLAAMEPLVVDIAARASKSSPDDLGSSCFLADIATMQHETLNSRIFRT